MEVAGTAGTLAEGREMGDLGIVLVDLRLPGGRGAKLVAEIKSRRPRLPVVVLSAENDLSDALEAGADEAINKSTPLPEIVATLRRIAGLGPEERTAGQVRRERAELAPKHSGPAGESESPAFRTTGASHECPGAHEVGDLIR